MHASYQVTLPVFEGPLDLLLHLIERQELDITQVSLALVTNQFLEYAAQLGERDPDCLADFLVVAAKLLLIKSRVLLPRPPAPEPLEEEVDEGEQLVQQLIEYRKFKEAAQWLKELDAQGLHSYVRLAATPRLEHSIDLGDVRLDDLLQAVRRVLEVKPPEPSINGTVPPLRVTVADQIRRILRATSRKPAVSFLALLRRARSRVEVIVTLLALLELVKQGAVSMRQEAPFGDILISARSAAPAGAAPQAEA